MNAITDRTRSMSEWLEALGKFFLVMGALAYAIGVVIVSSDLAKYRVATFSLARPQYILVGAMWLFITVIVMVPPTLIAYASHHIRLRSVKGISFSVLMLGALIYFVGAITHAIAPSPYGKFFNLVPAAFMEIFIFGLAYAFLWSFRKRELNQSLIINPREKGTAWWISASLYSIFILGLWVPVYTGFIFPFMDPNLGGKENTSLQ